MRLDEWVPAESLSLRALTWFFPINLIAILFLVATPDALRADPLAWLGIVLVTQLACFAILGVAQNLAISAAHRLVILLATGLARGLVIISVENWSQIDDLANPVGRLFNSTLTVTIWMMLIGRALHASTTYNAHYRSLFGQTTATALTLIGTEYRKITAPLSKLLEQASVQAVTEDSLRKIAEAIRDSVETRIRPFSHRIWFSELSSAPRVRLRMLFWDSLALPVPIARDFFILTIPATAVGFVVFESNIGGAFELVGLVLVSLPTLLGLQALSQRVRKSRFRDLAVLTAPALGFISSFLGHAVNELIDPTLSSLTSLAGLALALSLYAVLLTMYHLAKQDQELVVSAISDIAASPRELASFVHNTVQSGLLASASVLELASTSGNRDQVHDSIAQAQRLAGLDIASDFATIHGSPRIRLNGLANNWKGIAEIQLRVADDIADDELQLVLQIAEEAIANAVRKAHANAISVTVQAEQTALNVRISDNGKATPGEPGLGTAWLDSISNGNWNRKFSETGSELVVALPRLV